MPRRGCVCSDRVRIARTRREPTRLVAFGAPCRRVCIARTRREPTRLVAFGVRRRRVRQVRQVRGCVRDGRRRARRLRGRVWRERRHRLRRLGRPCGRLRNRARRQRLVAEADGDGVAKLGACPVGARNALLPNGAGPARDEAKGQSRLSRVRPPDDLRGHADGEGQRQNHVGEESNGVKLEDCAVRVGDPGKPHGAVPCEYRPRSPVPVLKGG